VLNGSDGIDILKYLGLYVDTRRKARKVLFRQFLIKRKGFQ
jgi:hypothetical protein